MRLAGSPDVGFDDGAGRQKPAVGFSCFFFNDTATTEIYTLSLHDALPISVPSSSRSQVLKAWSQIRAAYATTSAWSTSSRDRKSTRLNSSHSQISYAAFCLKKKTAPAIRRTYRALRHSQHHLPIRQSRMHE